MGAKLLTAAVILAWAAQGPLAAAEEKAPPKGAPARPAAEAADATPAKPADETVADGVTRVTDADKVCMMNDRYMGSAQIPVDVDGKRYYGCCAMCKERLARDRRARVATDPVTGKEVDKATAVMAKRADGSILYFENEANLKKYLAR